MEKRVLRFLSGHGDHLKEDQRDQNRTKVHDQVLLWAERIFGQSCQRVMYGDLYSRFEMTLIVSARITVVKTNESTPCNKTSRRIARELTCTSET